MIFKKLILFVFLVGLNPGFAQAQEIDEQTLLYGPFRPRIEALMPLHYAYIVPPNIPLKANHIDLPKYLNVLVAGAPHFIATLEKAYPGATFAFLGRDTQLLADVVDAFYITRGERGRVVQIATSKSTLDGLSNAQIVNYLKHAGLNLDDLSKDKPFIMVDTVSKGHVMQIGGLNRLVSGRQGRQIMQAVYEYWVNELGHKPDSLIKKFNFIGLQVSTFDTTAPANISNYRSINDLENIQETNKSRIQSGLYGYDMVVPLIADSSAKFNEAGYEHYTAAWHQKFLSPTVDGGDFVPRPGEPYDVYWRQSVMWIQHQIIDLVYQQNFQEVTEQYGNRTGVEFPEYIFKCRDLFLVPRTP